MASASKTRPPDAGSLDECSRIALLFLRYQGAPQRVLIHDLSALGLETSRVAALLGTTAATVRAEKREKRPDWPPKPPKS